MNSQIYMLYFESSKKLHSKKQLQKHSSEQKAIEEKGGFSRPLSRGISVVFASPNGRYFCNISTCKRSVFLYNASWKTLGHSLYYYSWNEPSKTAGARPRKREIDFLLTKGYSNAAGKPRVSPVEVKSSKSYSTVSLDDFAIKYAQRLGKEIVLHPKQLAVVGNREYLPLYMSFCI